MVVFLSLTIFFVLPLVSSSTGNIIQNQPILITQNCPNSTYSNLTKIQLMPNSSILLLGQYEMTKTGDDYNISLENNYTNYIGTLWIYGICNQNGDYTSWQYSLDITATGYNASLSQTLTMFFIIGIILIIGILLFIFGLKIDYIPIKITCLSLCLLLVVFLIGYILNIANITIGEYTNLTNGFNSIYILFIVLLSAWGIGIVIYLIVASLTAFQKTRGLRE